MVLFDYFDENFDFNGVGESMVVNDGRVVEGVVGVDVDGIMVEGLV